MPKHEKQGWREYANDEQAQEMRKTIRTKIKACVQKSNALAREVLVLDEQVATLRATLANWD